MIGSFLSAASCFWQPASSNAAAQTHIAGAIGNDKRLAILTDGGETDDVAFLLMGSPSRGLLIAMPRGCQEDNRSPGKGNRSRTRIARLVKGGIFPSQAQSPAGGADLRKT
ncbi:hypothetical protein GCM10007881_35650 [Mesorhizobium huakuii]|nr:hypothetical protein GCM10007881_35650 [Mesorhizobium huakuii]